MLDENAIKHKLLTRVLSGADEETAKSIMALGGELTVFRLLVVVAQMDSHLSRGLLVIRYGVTELQAKKARNEANKKVSGVEGIALE